MKRALVVGGLAGLLIALFASPASEAVGGLGVNPHDKADGCGACHLASTAADPGPVTDVIRLCRSCHPTADMHPVGMIPKNIHVAQGFPLEGGAVTCATCHANPTCDVGRSTVSPYLRGGTPERRMDFCYRCHEPTRLSRSNPHVTTAAPGEADGTCAACHGGLPTTGARTEDAKLRLAPDRVCATCHPGPIHAGALEHVGQKQLATTPADLAARLPRLDDGTIGCWTCHNVHDLKGNPTMLALPSDDGSLCRACHGKGP